MISKPVVLDLMFRRALFWLDLEILVFACVFMISWLATPTFFFSFLVLFAWFGYGTVHWNCGGKLVSGYGQLQSGSDNSPLRNRSATLQSFLLSIFLCRFCFFFLYLSIGGRLFFQVDIFF